MKNFIQRESLAFDGATLEEWLQFIGRRFLETYPHMERLRLSGTEIPFEPALVPIGRWRRLRSERSALRRGSTATDRRPARTRAHCDRRRRGDRSRLRPSGLQLMKVTGSIVRRLRARRVHDAARAARPAAVHPSRRWLALRHRPTTCLGRRPRDVRLRRTGRRHGRCGVPALREPVDPAPGQRDRPGHARALAAAEPRSRSRLRTGCGTWPSPPSDDERLKVYADPRPPYGRIGLVLRRD